MRATVWWTLLCLWMGLIFFASADYRFSGNQTSQAVEQVVRSASPRQVQEVNFSVRKAAHVALFAVLGALALAAIRNWPGARDPRLWALLLAALYAASDEWHQAYVPGRSSELSDVVLDSVAAALAIYVAPALLRRLGSRRTVRAPEVH